MAGLGDAVAYPDGHDPPRHLLEGVFQGMSELSGTTWHGLHTALKQPLRYAAREGLTGAGKGMVYGTLSFAESLVDGVLDMTSYVIEGVRNTPEALADYVAGEDRLHYRHFVDRQEGRMLETYIEHQPLHLPAGVKVGSEALLKGLAAGSTSLVTQNMEAVERLEYFRDIPTALGNGMLYGVTGFATKAAASSLDFAEAVVDGTRNTPDYLRWKAIPQVEIGSLRLTNAGSNAIISAAQKAGQLEQALREKASSAWQNGVLGIKPLGAPVPSAPVPPAQARAPEPHLAPKPQPGPLQPRPGDAGTPAPARPTPSLPAQEQSTAPAARPQAAPALPVPAAAAAVLAAAAARRAARLSAASAALDLTDSGVSMTTVTSRDRESLPGAPMEVAGAHESAGRQQAGVIFPQPVRGMKGPRPTVGLAAEAGQEAPAYAQYLPGYSDLNQAAAQAVSRYAQYPGDYSDMHQMVADRAAARYSQYPPGYCVRPQRVTDGVVTQWS